jgi:predicted small secreted protein
LEGDTVSNLLLIAAAVLVLAACNTIDGIGKDIKKAGESIEDAANRKK